MNAERVKERLTTLCGAEFETDDHLSAEDDLGRLRFQVGTAQVTVRDERGTAEHTTVCRTLAELVAALTPRAQGIGVSDAHRVITPFGRMDARLTVGRTYHGEERGMRLQLDTCAPLSLSGQALAHVRLFASAYGRPEVLFQREAGRWSCQPFSTLADQGAEVAKALYAALLCPASERAARVTEARAHLTPSAHELGRLRALRKAAAQALRLHDLAAP